MEIVKIIVATIVVIAKVSLVNIFINTVLRLDACLNTATTSIV